MKRWNKRGEWADSPFLLIPLILFVVAVMAISVLLSSPPPQTHTHDIWDAQAPFGHYWVDTEGNFVFGSGSIDSNLKESYTIKYLSGDELVTVICSATDPYVHLHLTGPNETTMKISIRYTGHADWDKNVGRYVGLNEYHIWVPDPKTIGGV